MDIGRLARRVAAASCIAAAGALAAGIEAPASWRKESFTFPLPYAPSLPYEGTEEVRFSPQWAHFGAPDGFTYAVLWEIRPTSVEGLALERALSVYFDGLMNNVAIARKLDAMVPQTQVALHPLAAPEGWSGAYAGAIHTWNGFAKAEPLVLNAEIAYRACGERMQVFFGLSEAPRAAPAWESLRRIRSATRCPG
ncbi:MAG TPA: hypothetical protein VFO24_00815 [Usitatibacter sp.]|nr:hypothetical protein [Usitatibacter sp.]